MKTQLYQNSIYIYFVDNCDMTKREKSQDLVFPDGVFYDKKTGTYRTPKHNTFFHAIKSETVNYKK